MFSLFTNACKTLYHTFASPLRTLLGRPTLDAESLEEVRALLLASDMGPTLTDKVMRELRTKADQGKLGEPLIEHLRTILLTILTEIPQAPSVEKIIMIVGVNGSGKTTTIAKLTAHARSQGKRVLLVAADTFRAAAPEQLQYWAQTADADIVTGAAQQDPASVIFTACQKFQKEAYDLMIIDTSGRVQTKAHLMDELAKLRRVITKQLPHEQVATLITIDSMLGQNSLQQAELFHACTPLSGIILTKLDGTGKGGIIFAITDRLKLPIRYITLGEGIDQLIPFDPHTFVSQLLS